MRSVAAAAAAAGLLSRRPATDATAAAATAIANGLLDSSLYVISTSGGRTPLPPAWTSSTFHSRQLASVGEAAASLGPHGIDKPVDGGGGGADSRGAGWSGPKPDWPGKRRPRGPAKGDEVLKSIQSARSLLDLEDLLDSNIRSLTYVHLGAAAMRTAKLVQQLGSSNGVAAAALDPRAVRQLQRLMKQLEGLYERAMPMLPVRPIAHLAYAAAKAGHHLSQRLMLTAAQHLMRGGGARLAAASGADLAQLSWGMAKANMWLPELQEAVDQAVIARAGDMDMRAVSILLTAAQLINNTDAQLLEALAQRALALAPGTQASQLVTSVHALVKLAHPSDAALQGIVIALAPQLGSLDDSSLVLLLEAYRLAGHPSAHTLAAAALPQIVQRASSFEPWQVVKVARHYSRMQQQGFVSVSSSDGGEDASTGSTSETASSSSGAGVSIGSPNSVFTAEGGQDECQLAAGTAGASSSSSSGSTEKPVGAEELWCAINAAAVAHLEKFEAAELQALLRSLGKRISPELRAAAEAAGSGGLNNTG